METVLLASVTPYVGKNVLTLGLAERFRSDGKKVGYFKPIGPLPTVCDGAIVDEDAAFVRRVMNLQEPLDQVCPLVLSEETMNALYRGRLSNVRDIIMSAYSNVSKGKDVLIVAAMGRLSSGIAVGFSMEEFARETNARVVVIARYHWPFEALDGILHMRALLPENFGGVIFNRVPASRVKAIRESITPFLKKHNVPVLGVVPDDVVLNAVPIQELVNLLNGRVLCGADKLDQLVENFSIGAMSAESALRFFQRVPNKAVITGGDRADIQLAALQTSTRCLLLTGDLYPNERILARADELGVPVVLVSRETAAVAEACDELHVRLTLHSDRKIARAHEVVAQNLDWDLVYKNLKLK